MQLLGADVAGHDDDRVAEVDAPALRIGQVPVLQDLEQDVEDLRMRLLDLVEEHHRVALAAHRLGQLAALVVADVAGRGADQARDVVALHELAHVDLDERVLGAEHELGQGSARCVLPTPVGPRKMNEPIGRLGSFSPARARRTALLMVAIAFLLADDALVERVLHVEQALGLLGADADDRDPGPHAHDLGDVLVGDDRRLLGLVLVPVFLSSSIASLPWASSSRSRAAAS